MFLRKKPSPSPSPSPAPPSHPFSAPPKRDDMFSLPPKVDEDEEQCPVCLESLSLRLTGEKPHIVPQCGHKLHEACFEAVYGSVQHARRTQVSLGLCGVCRRDMKLGDTDHRNKFAALSGLPTGTSSTGSSWKLRSISKRTIPRDGRPALHDPNDDDDILPAVPLYASAQRDINSTDTLLATRSISSGTGPRPNASQPRVFITSETDSISRPQDKDGVAHLTCMVTIEMPSKTPDARSAALASYDRAPPAFTSSSLPPVPPLHPKHSSHSPTEMSPPIRANSSSSSSTTTPHQNKSENQVPFPATASSRQYSPSVSTNAMSEYMPTPEAFVQAFNDLIARMSDWKGHSPSDFGPLKLYDYLHVRKDKAVREFLVYLFEDALLCVADDKRKGSSKSSDSPKLRLKGRVYIRHIQRVEASQLQGDDLNLTIFMEDDALDTFIMTFTEKPKLQMWKSQLESLIYDHQRRQAELQSPTNSNGEEKAAPPSPYTPSAPGFEDRALRAQPSQGSFRGSVLSADTHMSRSTATTRTISSAGTGITRSNTVSTAPTSYTSHPTPPSKQRNHDDQHDAQSLALDDDAAYYRHHNRNGSSSTVDTRPTNNSGPGSVRSPKYMSQSPNAYPPPIPSAGSSTSLPYPSLAQPKDLTPLDLIVIFSVPSSRTPAPETKLRLLRSTLDFLLHHLGQGSRISVVTFSSGASASRPDSDANGLDIGILKKTAFLSVDKTSSRAKLERVIETLGDEDDGNAWNREDDGYGNSHQADVDNSAWTLVDPKEDKVNVATAVNLALDIVLQRHQKAAVTGMILVNDGKDNTQKTQMDLIMARADAARVPLHAFGWGKTHDPSSLWLLSNHTSGSYTYVREWAQLKECLAGCVGGMISVASSSLKLHINVPEQRWFRIRKVAGVPNAILSSSGKDVDIEIGELRYGEKREMLVEVEMREEDLSRPNGSSIHEDQVDADEMSISSSSTRTQPRHPYFGNNRQRLSQQQQRPTFRSATDEFFIRSTGLNPLSLEDPNFYEEDPDSIIDECPLLEVQASYTDPATGKKVGRLPSPVLFTVTVTPPNEEDKGNDNVRSDPAIVRRRMECLTADMFLRSLLLMSRSNFGQATRLLSETKRILSTIIQTLPSMASSKSGGSSSRNGGNQRAFSNPQQVANTVLMACLEDVETLLEGLQYCRSNAKNGQHRNSHMPNAPPMDVPSLKNYATQQAITLRDQHAWTPRSLTERAYWTADHALWFVCQSHQWVGNH